MMVVSFSFFINSAVPKCIALEVVMMKGISFIYMMWILSVTFLCLVISSSGNSSYAFSMTQDGDCFVVLPLVILGLVLICLLATKYLSRAVWVLLSSTYLMKSLVLGLPIVSCRNQALCTSEYSLMFNAIYCVNKNVHHVLLNIREE